MMKKKSHISICSSILIALVSALILFFNSCNRSDYQPITIERYDVALMEIDTNRVGEELVRLYTYFPLFLEGADLNDADNQKQIFDFVTDVRSKEILHDIQKKYPDLKSLERAFGEAFGRYNKIFGREKIPTIYTYLSYLDYENRVVFMDSILVIGIDLYLGETSKHYDAVAIPKYMRTRLDEKFMPVDVMQSVAQYELEKTFQPQQTLLDQIVTNGKILYFLSQVLPKTDEATRFGYSDGQLAWCKQNEELVWSYLVGEKLLYEQNAFKYRAFVSESPTTQVFPGSPGRVGNYLGYKIVEKYMKNSERTIPELFAESDAQKILRVSNYRP